MRQLLDCHIYISLKSSSLAEYEYVKIFRQHFVVLKSQQDEKYALLSQETCILQNFTANDIEVGNVQNRRNFQFFSFLKNVVAVLSLACV